MEKLKNKKERLKKLIDAFEYKIKYNPKAYLGLTSEFQYLYYFTKKGYCAYKFDFKMYSGSSIVDNRDIFYYILNKLVNEGDLLEFMKIFGLGNEWFNKKVISIVDWLTLRFPYLKKRIIKKLAKELESFNGIKYIFSEGRLPDLFIYKEKDGEIFDFKLIEIKTGTNCKVEGEQKKLFDKINELLRKHKLKEIEILKARMTNTSCTIYPKMENLRQFIK